jgi:hypothetical protein
MAKALLIIVTIDMQKFNFRDNVCPLQFLFWLLALQFVHEITNLLGLVVERCI